MMLGFCFYILLKKVIVLFREMRRYKQQMTEDECREILDTETSGVLAVSGDDGYPYAVPMSFVCNDNKIYFHCAKSGHKLDAVRRESKASFCVIHKDDVVPEEFTTYYKSVITFGRIRVIDDGEKMKAAAKLLGRKYFPLGTEERLNDEISGSVNNMLILELQIEHMTGKMAKELIKK